ncbi:DUF2064 domain-containing protein [Rhodopirellula sp. SWK7]|uniref:TIGR04282 family arsenosugar biosynthesis glycosyltransferase n=1 Tax=Rhodopirellula sp. SWK7 TaxID=595460 RepID=UPI0002BDF6B2|nr:TIGR04282 family arsenosugar biosynthesis glycosyltransferase [Rhodopirellula sp. SWK7]EMI45212.1 hypothetical protein RRSWK_02201 [Rhodopirellula sp. SWK7]
MSQKRNFLVLGLMAKYWDPGRVKTRLAMSFCASEEGTPSLPAEVARKLNLGESTDAMKLAAMIHQRFVCHLLCELSDAGDQRQLVATPPERLRRFEATLAERSISNWEVIDQGGGDLGDRMKSWFAGQLFSVPRSRATAGKRLSETSEASEVADRSRGRSCVLIGADCPLLSQPDIENAWAQLQQNDVVIGPAFDGGYYLIGVRSGGADRDPLMSSPITETTLAGLFDGITWSTETVFEQTLAAANDRGLSVAVLEQRHDVDTAADLNRLVETIERQYPHGHPLFQNSIP